MDSKMQIYAKASKRIRGRKWNLSIDDPTHAQVRIHPDSDGASSEREDSLAGDQEH